MLVPYTRGASGASAEMVVPITRGASGASGETVVPITRGVSGASAETVVTITRGASGASAETVVPITRGASEASAETVDGSGYTRHGPWRGSDSGVYATSTLARLGFRGITVTLAPPRKVTTRITTGPTPLTTGRQNLTIVTENKNRADIYTILYSKVQSSMGGQHFLKELI